MIYLSQAGEYAIRGILFIASQPYGKTIVVKDVAKAKGIPKPFLAKIFQLLSKSGILRSHRGNGGGFSLAKPAKEISLLDIIETVEGKMALNNCILMGDCQNCEIVDNCLIISFWSQTKNRLIEALKSTSIEELSKRHQKFACSPQNVV